jgi:hypothetical protein
MTDLGLWLMLVASLVLQGICLEVVSRTLQRVRALQADLTVLGEQIKTLYEALK